ncbi:unnamed protein product, partial [Linum tenue]
KRRNDPDCAVVTRRRSNSLIGTRNSYSLTSTSGKNKNSPSSISFHALDSMADYTVHESNDPEKQGKPEFVHPVEDDEQLRKLLVPDPGNPRRQSSFRRRNQLRLLFRSRLCVIGLAPGHLVFKDEGGITAVDFNASRIVAADREGYVAIIMPRPADWLKV